jgi:hypothetical protein
VTDIEAADQRRWFGRRPIQSGASETGNLQIGHQRPHTAGIDAARYLLNILQALSNTYGRSDAKVEDLLVKLGNPLEDSDEALRRLVVDPPEFRIVPEPR